MKKTKKLLALLLAVCMLLSLSCTAVFAEGEDEGDEPEDESYSISIQADGDSNGDDAGNDIGDGDAGDGDVGDNNGTEGNETEEPEEPEESCNHESVTYIDNENRTHDVVCDACEQTVSTAKPHEYDENGTCECGAEQKIAYDEDSQTLTIIGYETVDKSVVSTYKTTAQKVIIKNVGTIEKEAFAEWRAMTELEINDVEFIGYAFRSCTGLKTLTIDNVGTIDTNAFFNPAALESVTIKNVGTVGNTVFAVYQGATALTSVTLENTDVGYQMFNGHKNLTNLTMSNVGTIGFQAFMNCTGLTELDLSSVKELGTSAFLGCTGLTGLEVDDTEVGTTAFYGCTGLESVTVKNIDAIGNQAFTGCTGLKSVTMENVVSIGEQVFSAYGNQQPACTALETVKMTNIGTIGKNAFNSCKSLESVTMENVDTIGQYAFNSCTSLETVTITGDVDTIDQYAFWYCSNLKTVNGLENVTSSIGGFAFYGCKSLTGLTVNDFAKMGFIGNYDEIKERVKGILEGTFKLDPADTIVQLPLTLETGWVGDVDRSEGWETNYKGGTQIAEKAHWVNATNGVAEVEVDAYYTAERQIDYIFVADLSASMSRLGNPEDANARIYDMQSKLLDMTSKLLNEEGYDCRVAIVSFGGMHNGNATHNATEFTASSDVAEGWIYALEPLNENTDYGLGLQEALVLATANKAAGRNTAVVFLSDGQPYLGAGTTAASGDLNGTEAAGKIKDLDVDIYGVLHSPTAASRDAAMAAMNAVCDEVYESDSTLTFGQAMDSAFAAASGAYTVTIPVNADDFTVGEPVISVSGGSTRYDEENDAIIWSLGMPFTQHTLTYTLTLKELPTAAGTTTYSINSGDATFGESGASVGIDLQLSRTVAPTGGGGGGGGGTPVTPPETEIEETEVPLAGAADLNRTDHIAYINGYADGTVRPENRITREEVATIFYRLLTEQARAIYETNENSFSDVAADRWSNTAISTLANAGIINGYADGTFRPANNVTRAELAAMAARFDEVAEGLDNPFSDTENHWAKDLISFAASKGWVNGYEDGSFRPDAPITRAETMKLINQVLERQVDEEGLLEDVHQWPDNDAGKWYYTVVLEATNTHTYERRAEDGIMENWLELNITTPVENDENSET